MPSSGQQERMHRREAQGPATIWGGEQKRGERADGVMIQAGEGQRAQAASLATIKQAFERGEGWQHSDQEESIDARLYSHTASLPPATEGNVLLEDGRGGRQ